MAATKKAFAISLLIALSGCAGNLSGALTGDSGLVTGAQSTIDQAINQLLMQKDVDLHNLSVGLQQINSQPGMVVMVPVTGAVSTTMTVAPVTTTTTMMPTMTPANPVSSPTVASPSLPSFPASPTVTPMP